VRLLFYRLLFNRHFGLLVFKKDTFGIQLRNAFFLFEFSKPAHNSPSAPALKQASARWATRWCAEQSSCTSYRVSLQKGTQGTQGTASESLSGKVKPTAGIESWVHRGKAYHAPCGSKGATEG
jgi:hypothetical protein